MLFGEDRTDRAADPRRQCPIRLHLLEHAPRLDEPRHSGADLERSVGRGKDDSWDSEGATARDDLEHPSLAFDGVPPVLGLGEPGEAGPGQPNELSPVPQLKAHLAGCEVDSGRLQGSTHRLGGP